MKKKFIQILCISIIVSQISFIQAEFLQDLGPAAKADWGSEAWGISWHPSGKFFISGKSMGGEVFSWDGRTIHSIEEIPFEADMYTGAWTTDGTTIALCGKNPSGEVRMSNWNGKHLSTITTVAFGSAAISASWDATNTYLAVGGSNGASSLTVYEWDSLTLTTCDTKNFTPSALSVMWSPNGKYLAAGGANNTEDVIVYGWDASSKTLIDLGSDAKKDHGAAAYAIAWSPDGKYLAVGGSNDTTDLIIYSWNGTSLTYITSVDFTAYVYTIMWDSTGRYLIAGGENDGNNLIVYEWDTTTLIPIQTLESIDGAAPMTIAWSPNNKIVAIGKPSGGETGEYNLELYFTHYTYNPSGKFANQDIIQPYIFHDFKNSAGGVVKFEEGFTVLPDAVTYLNLYTPVSGGIDMNETGKIILEGDLKLDSNCTLSSGGIIDGQGYSIILNNNLTIPAHSPSILEIVGDLIIDGQGNDMLFDSHCQILVDTNVTLTLKNMTIKTVNNTPAEPVLRGLTNSSKIALDNVTIAPDNDFYFDNGQLFIHNDVVFTGSSSFVYRTGSPCSIAQHTCLYFGPGTTLDYRPTTNNRSLFTFKDSTAKLCLNGCGLHTTATGIQLTKGSITINNTVTFTSNGVFVINQQTKTGGLFDTFPGEQMVTPETWLSSCAWSPNGNHAVAGCYVEPVGGFVKTFTFVGTASDGGFVENGTGWQKFGDSKGQVESVAWNPKGKHVAVSGFSLTGGNYRGAIKVYRLVSGGSTGGLEEVGSGEYHFPGGEYAGVYSIAWSPDGNYVVAGNGNVDTGEGQIKVFRFVENGNSNGSVETLCDGYQPLGTHICSINWSSDGNYIVVGALDESLMQGFIKTYQFTGSGTNGGLEEVGTGQQNFATEIYSTQWSPDGNYILASGYYDMGSQVLGYLKTYFFTGNGTTGGLEEVGTNEQIFKNYVYSAKWSPDGNYIIAGSDDDILSVGEVKVFSFTRGGTQGGIATVGIGSQQIESNLAGVDWSNDGKYILAASHGIKAFSVDYICDPAIPQTFSNGITFGNSKLGSEYDVDINIAPGAQLNINGIVTYDNVQ